jgi:ribosomal protein S18 acetylase RimI-like enzyme
VTTSHSQDAVTVSAIAPDEQPRAVATLTLAFSADPVMRWLWPDAHRYLRYWPRFVGAMGGEAFGRGSAHALGDGRGVALWLPPGVGPDDAALGQVMIESLETDTLGQVSEISEQMTRFHPTIEHWYLAFLGVDPSAQGGGLGSGLLAHGLARCDRDGLPAYLEASSPRNRDLYRRFGFQVVGVIQAGTSPPIWAMFREPAPTA